jgi:hypothetical protein
MLAGVDWIAVTTAAVAVATLVLAIATWRLVGFTKKEAEAVRLGSEATERQAEITARALSASTRPWLTANPGKELVPVELHPGIERNNRVGTDGYVMVRNAGQGLAVIPRDSSLVWGRDTEDRVFNVSRHLFPDSSILAPGEFTALRFFVPEIPYQMFVGSKVGYDFFLHVLYTDADGSQPTVASFRVSAYPDRSPSVFEISYRHLDAVPSLAEASIFEETEPFAIVRPGLPG